jgi:hypothetical protein
MTGKHHRDLWPAIIAAIVLLATLYVGAYFGTIRRSGNFFDEFHPQYVRSEIDTNASGLFGGPRLVEWTDEQHRTQDFLERLFAPIHWIDRRLRPRYWNVR